MYDVEEEILMEEPTLSIIDYIMYPFTIFFTYLSMYGWYILGSAIMTVYLLNKLMPKYRKWQQAREDAIYHKNPDIALARMEAVQRARERQQQLLAEASERAKEEQKEREERKKQENLERLKKYGSSGEGQRLGTFDDADLPLSRGESSSYRPPKKSKCGGGGCGK